MFEAFMPVHAGACPCCMLMKPRARRSAFVADDGGTSAAVVRQAAPAAAFASPIWFEGGNIVNPRDGSVTAGMSILTDQGRIIAIEPAGAQPAPGVARIDITGKFVVPGFNDMHSHVLELENPSGALALLLADGITGFRQMSGSDKMVLDHQQNRLPIGEASPAPLQVPGDILTPFNATSPETVAEEIRRQKAQGVDFVKAGVMNAPVFVAALKAAKEAGVPLLGHLQDGVDPAEAAALGFASIEHLGPGATIWVACSTDQAALREDSSWLPNFKVPRIKIPFMNALIMWRFQTILVNPSAFIAPGYVARMQHAFDTFDEAKCHALIDQFVALGTWHVPTLVRLRTQELADAPEYAVHEDLRTMPAKKVRKWRQVTKRFTKMPAATRASFRAAYVLQMKLAKMLAEGGVRMLTGSDGGWLAGPGLTLQEEFLELSKAGLAPLHILQMTTCNPADYLGRSDVMGAVAPGYHADLVLLDGNPAEDVANLRRISGVVRAGRYFSHAELAALKAKVIKNRGYL
jgi:imidazolonepropionase-like amidohydrolase